MYLKLAKLKNYQTIFLRNQQTHLIQPKPNKYNYSTEFKFVEIAIALKGNSTKWYFKCDTGYSDSDN